MCHPAGPAPRVSVHQIWRLPAPSKVSLSADLALQPSSLRQLEFTTTPAECRLPALFGSQRLSKPIARSCQIAAQPLPSYDSVRSAPATTFRRSSASVRRAASDRDLSSSDNNWKQCRCVLRISWNSTATRVICFADCQQCNTCRCQRDLSGMRRYGSERRNRITRSQLQFLSV